MLLIVFLYDQFTLQKQTLLNRVLSKKQMEKFEYSWECVKTIISASGNRTYFSMRTNSCSWF